jgi:hypothetical protein
MLYEDSVLKLFHHSSYLSRNNFRTNHSMEEQKADDQQKEPQPIQNVLPSFMIIPIQNKFLLPQEQQEDFATSLTLSFQNQCPGMLPENSQLIQMVAHPTVPGAFVIKKSQCSTVAVQSMQDFSSDAQQVKQLPSNSSIVPSTVGELQPNSKLHDEEKSDKKSSTRSRSRKSFSRKRNRSPEPECSSSASRLRRQSRSHSRSKKLGSRSLSHSPSSGCSSSATRRKRRSRSRSRSTSRESRSLSRKQSRSRGTRL